MAVCEQGHLTDLCGPVVGVEAVDHHWGHGHGHGGLLLPERRHGAPHLQVGGVHELVAMHGLQYLPWTETHTGVTGSGYECDMGWDGMGWDDTCSVSQSLATLPLELMPRFR